MASSGMEAEKRHSEDRLLGSLEERPDSEGHDSDDDMADPTEHDREILSQEAEREKLLGERHPRRELERTGNSSRGVRKRKKSQGGEKAELIFEMEEGGLRDDSSSQSGLSLLEPETEGQDDEEGVRVGWLLWKPNLRELISYGVAQKINRHSHRSHHCYTFLCSFFRCL